MRESLGYPLGTKRSGAPKAGGEFCLSERGAQGYVKTAGRIGARGEGEGRRGIDPSPRTLGVDDRPYGMRGINAAGPAWLE